MARTIPFQTGTSPGQAGTAPDQAGTAPSRTGTAPDHAPPVPARRGLGAVVGLVAALAVIVAGVFGLTALHLLQHLRNPFAESTTVRSQPPLLKSITSLSRYQAASGSFQVIVNLSRKTPYLPSFIEGSDTLAAW